MTTLPNLVTAAGFVFRTARLIDRLRFLNLIEEAPAATVIAALRPYQNPDGGCGQALEPDLRCPQSQPVPTWSALTVLDEVGAFADPMVDQMCNYLLTITTPEGGVPFVLPSVRDYPHAPWWEPGDNSSASLNPTACIVALLHKHRVNHPWVAQATAFCWQAIDQIDATSPYVVRAILPFLEHVPDHGRATAAFARIGPKLLADNLVALDPETVGEVHMPLDFAPRPESLARQLFADDLIAAHLDAIATTQQPDGGWLFNWQQWNPATSLEWRGWLAVEKLRTLRAYGRLP